MASPIPKLPAQRRNRNAPRSGEWRPSKGHGWQHGPIPPCPDGLSAETQAAWATWMSVGFAVSNLYPGDLPGLRVIARLHDAFTNGDMTRATELRLWLDTYGLTPHGLQQRRWQPPATEDPKPRSSTLARLRVVDATIHTKE